MKNKPLDPMVGLKGLLQQHGFVSRSGRLLLPISDGFCGWLGFNAPSKHGDVELNLVVGVRSTAIESLVADLCVDDPRLARSAKAGVPTIARPISYLMPEARYNPWFFLKDSDDWPYDDVISAVERYAKPFMSEHASLSSLLEYMRNPKTGIINSAIYRIPVALYLLGDMNEARIRIKADLLTFDNRTDPGAIAFRGFASRFLDLLAAA